MSSVLTARGVPGGTAAKTFDDAYLDELSKPAWTKMENFLPTVRNKNTQVTYEAMVNEIETWAPILLAMAIVQNQQHSDQYY